MSRANDQTLLDDILHHQTLPLPLVKQSAREILALIREGLIRDGVVTLSNFGSFRLKPVAARRGINPHTRERIMIPAHQRVLFTPCKALRELIEPNHQPPIPLEQGRVSNQDACPVAVDTEATTPDIDSLPTLSQRVMEQDSVTYHELDLGRLDEDEPSERKHHYRLAVAAVVLFALVTAAMFVDVEEAGTQSGSEPLKPVVAMEVPALNTNPEGQIGTLPPAELTVAHSSGVQSKAAGSASQGEEEGANFFSEQHHQLAYGESLWLLAARHYHAPLLWPHIFQANQEAISDPDHLLEGATLLIPNLQGSPDALTSDDRSNIAEGYYLAYLHYKQQGRSEAFFALLAAKHYDVEVVERHREQLQLSRIEQSLLAM